MDSQGSLSLTPDSTQGNLKDKQYKGFAERLLNSNKVGAVTTSWEACSSA